MSIIAIDGGNTELAGALVYWRLSGEANGDDFNNGLKSAGLSDHTIKLTSPKAALRRTLQESASGATFLRAGRSGDPALYLVRQSTDDGEPTFDVDCKATLGVGSVPKFETDQHTSAELTKRFWHHVFHLSTNDISSWLIGQAWECDALSLRDSGGVYFIPRHAIDAWKQRAEVVHEQSESKIYMIPAVQSDDAVEAVLAALVDECNTFTQTLQAEMADEDSELGERALNGRAERAGDLLKKLGRYENLLGRKLDDIREQVTEQQTNAINMALLSGGE